MILTLRRASPKQSYRDHEELRKNGGTESDAEGLTYVVP